ncbi:magnesium transporter NIPA1 [Salarias fasciatus]|uniref:NIPA magnesium transporter 1 n=1 Tax=Salarias fasciatus TaxID=181472 RepID=A0A672H908_SALFA|nr:magnesium transporter NIPA1 [Salarias fasciatus]
MDGEPAMQIDWKAGIAVAVVSSLINGAAFVLQKKGMLRSNSRGVSHYFDVVWLSGMACLIVGQLGNFLAFKMIPAVLVTSLGALGVLFGAVLASWILQESFNILGKLACVLCCCGSVNLILKCPDQQEISWLDLLERLQDKVFVGYMLLVTLLVVTLIVLVAPAYGRSYILVYVAICSLLGAFTVPSCKGLHLVGAEIFREGGPSDDRAWPLFLGLLGTLVVSIRTQLYFIQESLKYFSSNMFQAIYFVMFTFTVSFTSALLFKEWTALTVIDRCAMLCALITVCVGVVLLCISQEEALKKKKAP